MMIPAGVFNQGSGESKLFFVNINGSYWELMRPSTRTWPEEYDEFEGMYSTTNNTTSSILGGYQVYIPVKTGVGAQFGLGFTLAGVNRIVNQPLQTSNSRIERALRVNTTSAFTEIIMESLPVGTMYKLHFYSSTVPSYVGSLRVTIIETGLANEVLERTSTVNNPFVLTPYEPGGDTSWLSTEWRTAVASSRIIKIQSVTGQGYLNAFCLEVLGGGAPPPPPPILTSITVNPSMFELSTGSARQLEVIANYSNGSTADITNDATYSSSNSSVAAVNSTGLVSGVSQGSTTINISYEGETTSSSATVTVPATLTSISVSPTSASIQVGSGRQLTVTAHYDDSSQVNITGLASYTRTNTRISVNSTGYITANTQGASGVDISYQGQTTSMSVTVTVPTITSISISPSSINMSVGSTRQLTVTAHYSDSSTANVTSSASYGTSNSSRATVSSSGLVTAGSTTGSVNITASYGGYSDGINVNVTAATVTSISISPTSFSIAQGKTQQLVVTAHMSDSSTQTVTGSASYSSNQTGRATVSGSGLVTASNSNTGAVNITATYQGYSAVSSGTITAATVESISVSPTSVSLPMGRTQQLTVTANLSNGGTQTVTSSASYSSNNTGRATVSSGGLITAGNTTGAATITITYSGRSTTMTSTTTAAVVNSLSVSPTSFSIAQGLTQQLTVTAAMSNGTNQNVTSAANYSSNQTGRATVNSTGLVTASGSTGAVNITATYGGQNAVSSGTVTAAIVNSISVNPSSFSVEVGSTRQLTVTAAMSNGTNQTVTSSATYTRTNSNITVSSGGLVTGSSAGSSGVNISYGGKSTSTSITVTQVVKTIVELQVVDVYMGLPVLELQLNSNTSEIPFLIRARYNDNSIRDLESWEYHITDPFDTYIKFDSMSLTPRVYYEGWNVPPMGYNITTSINYTGTEPSNVETHPLTVRYGAF